MIPAYATVRCAADDFRRIPRRERILLYRYFNIIYYDIYYVSRMCIYTPQDVNKY